MSCHVKNHQSNKPVNQPRLSFTSGNVRLDPSGQRRPIFSSFDNNTHGKKEYKVQLARDRLAAWCLDRSSIDASLYGGNQSLQGTEWIVCLVDEGLIHR